MAISEARRYVGEDEQLTSSCFITAKPSKWVMADSITLVQWSSKYLLHEKLDPFNMSVGHMGVSKLANPADQVEKSMEFKLCYTTVSARTSSVMYNKMCSFVFNRECKVENYNI